MTAAQEADRFQRAQQRLVRAAVAYTAARWSRVDRDNILLSWEAMLEAIVAAVARAQHAAATQGGSYVTRIADAQGVSVDRQVDPAAFAGHASDGRPLDTLLHFPAVMAVRQISRGASPAQGLSHGRFALRTFVSTQVYDASRTSSQALTVATRPLGGYRRQLRGSTNCARCVMLAGKWFRWNAGFQRHPNCDCVHVPAVGPKSDVADVTSFDPKAYFDSLTEEQQDRIFTKGSAQAIRDGADMNQVVNARRSMRTAYDARYGRVTSTTLEGTTRHGAAAKTMAKTGARFDRAVELKPGLTGRIPARPMPEEIYRAANGDRDLAIRALARFGYIA